VHKYVNIDTGGEDAGGDMMAYLFYLPFCGTEWPWLSTRKFL